MSIRNNHSFNIIDVSILGFICHVYGLISEHIINRSRKNILNNYIRYKRHVEVVHYIHAHDITRFKYGTILHDIGHRITNTYIKSHMSAYIHKHLLIKALNLNFLTLLFVYILFIIGIFMLYNNLYIYNGSSNIFTSILKFYSAQGLTGISMYFLILGLINIRSVYKLLCINLAIFITPLIFIFFSIATISYIDLLYTDNIFIDSSPRNNI